MANPSAFDALSLASLNRLLKFRRIPWTFCLCKREIKYPLNLLEMKHWISNLCIHTHFVVVNLGISESYFLNPSFQIESIQSTRYPIFPFWTIKCVYWYHCDLSSSYHNLIAYFARAYLQKDQWPPSFHLFISFLIHTHWYQMLRKLLSCLFSFFQLYLGTSNTRTIYLFSLQMLANLLKTWSL